MNRLAIHESAATDLSPTELVDLAKASGFDSIGLKVAHSRGADRWWRKGAGSAELGSTVEHLLTNRISVLDVGRVELGGPPNAESYRSVLDLSSRFGARYVTAGAVPRSAQSEAFPELFAQLVADCDDYQLVPLLVPLPGTAVATTSEALEVVRVHGGGIVLNISTELSAFDIETQVLEAGNRLGYLRLHTEDFVGLTEDSASGLLATVPVHVPIAVGSNQENPPVGDLTTRARGWRELVDRMLEHPLARAKRLGATEFHG